MTRKYKKGWHHSDASKKRISDAHKGKVLSQETLQKMRGRVFSESHKENIRKSQVGKKLSVEHSAKISASLKGRKFSQEHKGKIAKALTGNSWNKGRAGKQCGAWRGGVTPLNKLIRSSREYGLWREAVFTRDNWTCIWCGAKSGNGVAVILNADHIKPFAHYPELRFAIDNGRTLCEPCHKTTDTYGGRALKIKVETLSEVKET